MKDDYDFYLKYMCLLARANSHRKRSKYMKKVNFHSARAIFFYKGVLDKNDFRAFCRGLRRWSPQKSHHQEFTNTGFSYMKNPIHNIMKSISKIIKAKNED